MTTQQAPYVRNVLKKHEDEILAQEASLGAMSITLEEVEANLEVVNDGLTRVTVEQNQHKGLLQDLLRESATHEAKLLDHERLLGGQGLSTAQLTAMLNLLLSLGFLARMRWFFFGTLPETPMSTVRRTQ